MSNTNGLYKVLFPPLEEIKKVPSATYTTNAIIFKSVLLYGHQGIGKTELVRALTEEAIKRYGEENVNAKYVLKGKYLPALMHLAFDDKLIQILFIDNATLSKIPNSTLEEFFAIRHKWYDQTKRPNGYILAFIAAHRFHGVNLSLRTDNDAIIVLNSPSNPYDRSVIKKYVGDFGITKLNEWDDKRNQDPTYKEYSVYWTRTNIDILKLPMATKNYLEEIPVTKCEFFLASPFARLIQTSQ